MSATDEDGWTVSPKFAAEHAVSQQLSAGLREPVLFSVQSTPAVGVASDTRWLLLRDDVMTSVTISE